MITEYANWIQNKEIVNIRFIKLNRRYSTILIDWMTSKPRFLIFKIKCIIWRNKSQPLIDKLKNVKNCRSKLMSKLKNWNKINKNRQSKRKKIKIKRKIKIKIQKTKQLWNKKQIVKHKIKISNQETKEERNKDKKKRTENKNKETNSNISRSRWRKKWKASHKHS